jgi:hypothetical protein
MEIAHYNEMGRGFRANESIPASSELLRVPQKLWLTIDSVLTDPEIGPILSQYPSLQQVRFYFFVLFKFLSSSVVKLTIHLLMTLCSV